METSILAISASCMSYKAIISKVLNSKESLRIKFIPSVAQSPPTHILTVALLVSEKRLHSELGGVQASCKGKPVPLRQQIVVDAVLNKP
ncbi:hypothetical protein OOU_Y34scaffold00758g2 [Pyricularia oryzae Y34]|uniref:Uncharacterized protein n=2 Tax=Pyricularia oryzae TaxID=318829 RepID=A0AA97NQT8_PYRO3|nr:hypothetical protein OOU_Y34scaffold00758g2 [Pyricularia oryzae Y34]